MAINEGLRNRSDLPIETADEWSRTEVAWLAELASAGPTACPPSFGNFVVAWYPPKLFLAGDFVLVPALHVRTAGRASSRQPHADLGMVLSRTDRPE